MARVCEICGKGHVVGHNVSHANNKTKRLFSPNLKAVRVTIEGTHRRINVCTRCIRSGLIQKPPRKSAVV
jgi:large subunit ribosomal protein L28